MCARSFLLHACVWSVSVSRRFGAAVAGAGGGELQQHENQPVQTVFLRAGKRVELELVPRRWDGRGLLGCHLRPL